MYKILLLYSAVFTIYDPRIQISRSNPHISNPSRCGVK